MAKKKTVVRGSRIVDIHAGGFSNRPLIVYLDTGELCKMSIKEVLKMVNEFSFVATPKRMYRHLTVNLDDYHQEIGVMTSRSYW